MTQASGIAPLEAYILGYDTATPTPALGAEVSGETITFNFAGTTPRTINGLDVSYKVQKSSDNSTWTDATTTPTATGATLAIANAGLYNRLVARIAAE